MKILNVVEIVGDGGISVNSFTITEDSVRRSDGNNRKIRQAEKLFAQKARENGMLMMEAPFCIENEYFELGDYKLFLVWSE